MKDIIWFLSVCADNGLPVAKEQADQFEGYRKALLSWNTKINLISRKDEEHFYSRHVLNCISFLFANKLCENAAVVDLGTGGGLPGIPIKILYPHLKVLFVDSIAKKTMALSSIVKELSLTGVDVRTARAEEIAKTDEFNSFFDYVITRAAGKLHEVVKWSRLFLGEYQPADLFEIPKGVLIVLKGGEFDEELNIARKLKFVNSVEVTDLVFRGMDEIDNREKKLVVVTYRRHQHSYSSKRVD